MCVWGLTLIVYWPALEKKWTRRKRKKEKRILSQKKKKWDSCRCSYHDEIRIRIDKDKERREKKRKGEKEKKIPENNKADKWRRRIRRKRKKALLCERRRKTGAIHIRFLARPAMLAAACQKPRMPSHTDRTEEEHKHWLVPKQSEDGYGLVKIGAILLPCSLTLHCKDKELPH